MSEFNLPDGVEPKVVRLPRNGPKPGQSTSAWMRGKQQENARWASQSPQAGYDALKGRKLGRVQRGQLKP